MKLSEPPRRREIRKGYQPVCKDRMVLGSCELAMHLTGKLTRDDFDSEIG